MTKFHERLKELRTDKGLSQSQLAGQLNVDFRTISNWENGVRQPNINTLVVIAKFFEVSADYLLGISD